MPYENLYLDRCFIVLDMANIFYNYAKGVQDVV